MTDLTLALDNRINISGQATKVVRISGVQNNFFEINPEGSGYTSNIIFQNVITPSLSNTVVSRNMRIRYKVVVSATATPPILSPDVALGADGAACALRAFPLASVCDTILLQVNGASTSVPSRYILSATQRTIPADYIKKEATECPSMADNAACLIQDALGTSLSSQQPLSSYYNSDGTTRASFQPVAFDDAAHTVTFEVSEPIMVSPLTLFSEENFIANLNTLSLQFQYSNLLDMFVFSGAQQVPAGFTVAIQEPHLELTYIQVANDIVAIPRMVQYAYETPVYFSKAVGTMAHTNALASYTVSTDTVRLQSMPSRVYFFVRPQITGRTSAVGSRSQADAFLSLGGGTQVGGLPSLTVNIGNRTGLLASASAKTLYRMSVRNGYRGTWNDWAYGSGSLVIIDPVEDLGINLQAGDILPGESGSVNLQITANFNNANYVAATAQVGGADIAGLALESVLVCVYSGVCSITADNCVFNIGELSEAEVSALLKTAPKEGAMVSSEVIKPTIGGGSLFGKFKSILGHTARGLQAVASHPMTQMLAKGRGLRGGVFTQA